MTLLTWLEPLRLGPAVVMQVGLLPGLVGVTASSQSSPAQSSPAKPSQALPAQVLPDQPDGQATASPLTPEQVRRLPGYRVVANRVGDAWRYVAWGPDAQPSAWRYREYSNGQCRHWHPEGGRIRYPLGSAIPQRRLLIGAHITAALAREQCQAHANAQPTVLIPG
jgi:hypothetical protein